MRVLCNQIWEIYEAKIEADKTDDEAGNERDEMDEFVFEFFLHKYGLYTLAIKHMVNLVFALIQGVGVTLPCVQLFRRFCFLEVSDPSKNMTREILDLILSMVTHITLGPGDPMPNCEPMQRYVPLARMRSGLRKALKGHYSANEIDQAISRICGKHMTLRTKTSPSRDIECCSLDEALVLGSEIGMAARAERQRPIKAAFNAADDGDGVMTFAEFDKAVKSLMPDVQKSQLMRMFRDALNK